MKRIIDYRVGDKINHKSMGDGVIVEIRGINPPQWVCDFTGFGRETVMISENQLVEERKEVNPLDLDDIKQAMREVFREEMLFDDIELGERWTGGTMILKPNRDDLTPKEIPLEAFFHKIVMLRDRLRVLEQKINSHKNLTNEEKVEFQQYITRSYGSLTTFNVLFSKKEDWFVGQSN